MTEAGIIQACCACPCMKTLIAQVKIKYPDFEVSHKMCKNCIIRYYSKEFYDELVKRGEINEEV